MECSAAGSIRRVDPGASFEERLHDGGRKEAAPSIRGTPAHYLPVVFGVRLMHPMKGSLAIGILLLDVSPRADEGFNHGKC